MPDLVANDHQRRCCWHEIMKISVWAGQIVARPQTSVSTVWKIFTETSRWTSWLSAQTPRSFERVHSPTRPRFRCFAPTQTITQMKKTRLVLLKTCQCCLLMMVKKKCLNKWIHCDISIFSEVSVTAGQGLWKWTLGSAREFPLNPY